MNTIRIYPENCLDKDRKVKDDSVMLGIFDPPFGIGESNFDKHYNRNGENVISGYKEAPQDYENWTYLWMKEAQRVLHPDGSMYIFMGYNNLRHVLNAAHKLELFEINHIIWKYNFGVYTRRKYVSSHYHVLYYGKSIKSKPVFNLNCRFGSQEKDENGGSLLYRDLEDVFVINKDYSPGETKNQNKLPEEIIRKIVMYSSNPGDLVCDFFMGNFTTAYVSLGLGRNVCGYEINKESFDYHMPILHKIDFGHELKNIRQVVNEIPENQGKKITEEEIQEICKEFIDLSGKKVKIKDIEAYLQRKFKRGRFSIKNILKNNLEKRKG